MDNIESLEYDPVEKTLTITQSTEPQRPIEDDLRNENSQIVVSSRMVAERFGKEHKTVLRSIEDITAQNCALINKYYMPSTYTAGTGKSYKEYLMNRDGFTLLAIGFTGKEALKNQSPALPTTYKDALIALVAEVEVKE